jgi:hypothetical protein
MKHSQRLAALFLLAAAVAAAQDQWFTAKASGSLSAAATTATLQQVPQGNKDLILDTATVTCPAACDITQSQNGTAATATAGTIAALNPSAYARSAAAFYSASNVGSGTSVGPTISCSAACTVVIDLTRITIPRGSAGLNYSVAISAVTGAYSITFQWRER